MEWRARLRRLSRPVNTFQVVALRRLQQLLLAPTDALPLDLFRVAVGLLAVAYLLRAAFEAPIFSSPDGLIDHELSEEIFPYTIQPLFRPWMTIGLVRAILGVSCLLAFGIVFGIAPRICAFVLYVVVACWYRFHFLTVYVDDSLLHLWLLWVALMPVGTTLAVGSWFRGRPVLAEWAKQQVPGASVRLFLGNIALMYFVAGTTKWTSRLWLEGNALYAVLKLPAAWFPGFWQEWHLAALVLCNYAALIVEPLLALIVFLPSGRPLKKWLGVGLFLLHAGVIATFDAPVANLACLAATLLIFRHEIMGFLAPGRRKNETSASDAPPRWRPAERFGALVLVLLTITMLLSMRPSGWRKPSRGSNAIATAKTHADDGLTGDALETSFYGALWVLGLAQQFRLLDWVDERNFYVQLLVKENEKGVITPVSPTSLVPRGTRGALILSYGLGITWVPVAPDPLLRLRAELQRRLGRRYCAAEDQAVSVAVDVLVKRLDPLRPDPGGRSPFMRFTCFKGRVLDQELFLNF